jgi:hypothetical protein
MRYNYTQALGRLTEWAEKEGYTNIIFDHNDISQIDWKENTLNKPSEIKIQGKYPIEIKVYLLLHELGHHQLRKNWGKFTKKLPMAAEAEHIHFMSKDGKYKRRVTYTVSCMEEEFKAWEEGFKLADRLLIKINEKKWNELKAKCLIAYMRYYGAK